MTLRRGVAQQGAFVLLKRLTLLLSLIMTFALASTAVAQTPTTDEDPVEALNRIASDVTIYGRSYETDMTGTPDVSSEMVVASILQAYDLGDADVAAESFPYVEQLMKDQLASTIDGELTTEERDDLGDHATISTGELETAGVTVDVSLVLVQQEGVIFLSAAVVMNGEADTAAIELMEFILDGEPGDIGDVEFNEDGTSTGGYFDVFPAIDDVDALTGLQVSEDMYETMD
jgi:hypothetical protein